MEPTQRLRRFLTGLILACLPALLPAQGTKVARYGATGLYFGLSPARDGSLYLTAYTQIDMGCASYDSWLEIALRDTSVLLEHRGQPDCNTYAVSTYAISPEQESLLVLREVTGIRMSYTEHTITFKVIEPFYFHEQIRKTMTDTNEGATQQNGTPTPATGEVVNQANAGTDQSQESAQDANKLAPDANKDAPGATDQSQDQDPGTDESQQTNTDAVTTDPGPFAPLPKEHPLRNLVLKPLTDIEKNQTAFGARIPKDLATDSFPANNYFVRLDDGSSLVLELHLFNHRFGFK